jgi:hypothetical protein
VIDQAALEGMLGRPIDRRQPPVVPTSVRALGSGHLELRFGMGGQDERGYERDGVWLLDLEADYSPDEIRSLLRRWCDTYPRSVVDGPRMAYDPDDMTGTLSRIIGKERDGGGGWLGPNGEWWPCPDVHHQQTAEKIVVELHLHFGKTDPEHYLHQVGWLHIKDSGAVLSGWDRCLSQAQLDRLFDLATTYPTMREPLLARIRHEQS